MDKIITKYKQLCETPSDIFEHLPVLKQYAERCAHITEMGVRTVVSTYAFLAAEPFELVCYDIARHPNVDEAEKLAAEAKIKMTFHEKDVLSIDIAVTDVLFIDTLHVANQLSQELGMHSGNVRKYIIMHDTTSFWLTGEPPYNELTSSRACGKGLRYAIEPFLENNPEWEMELKLENNNGLTVLRRVK